jgi:hypothetical protein
LSRMKLVISQKAWHVTTCSRGIIDDDELMWVCFVSYVCVCTCDGAWNPDLVKMMIPFANSECHNGKRG